MNELKKKDNEEMYAVADPSWFALHTEVVSAPEDNGDICAFMIAQSEGRAIGGEFAGWLNEHEQKSDYYFALCADTETGECYAVAYEGYDTAAYAVVLDVDIDELNLS